MGPLFAKFDDPHLRTPSKIPQPSVENLSAIHVKTIRNPLAFLGSPSNVCRKIGNSRTWVLGQNLDRAGSWPCTDPQEHLIELGHSSDLRWPWCGPLEWPSTQPVSGHWKGPAQSGVPVDRCWAMPQHDPSSRPAPRSKSPKSMNN